VSNLSKAALAIALIGIIIILAGYFKPGLIFLAITAFLICVDIGDK